MSPPCLVPHRPACRPSALQKAEKGPLHTLSRAAHGIEVVLHHTARNHARSTRHPVPEPATGQQSVDESAAHPCLFTHWRVRKPTLTETSERTASNCFVGGRADSTKMHEITLGAESGGDKARSVIDEPFSSTSWVDQNSGGADINFCRSSSAPVTRSCTNA